jgi:glycosyltransferase involved in cell wall biosynthesis
VTDLNAATVDVVLPSLDEASALPWVLERIPPTWRAIVVDNGSSDGSDAIASALGATVVHEPERGFGAACQTGLLAAEAEFVCFYDCDASLDPGLLPALVQEVADGKTDLVLGRRRPKGTKNLFTFAQVSLLQAARALRAQGIDVAVVGIPSPGTSA